MYRFSLAFVGLTLITKRGSWSSSPHTDTCRWVQSVFSCGISFLHLTLLTSLVSGPLHCQTSPVAWSWSDEKGMSSSPHHRVDRLAHRWSPHLTGQVWLDPLSELLSESPAQALSVLTFTPGSFTLGVGEGNAAQKQLQQDHGNGHLFLKKTRPRG